MNSTLPSSLSSLPLPLPLPLPFSEASAAWAWASGSGTGSWSSGGIGLPAGKLPPSSSGAAFLSGLLHPPGVIPYGPE
jgi:hypothetical protein